MNLVSPEGERRIWCNAWHPRVLTINALIFQKQASYPVLKSIILAISSLFNAKTFFDFLKIPWRPIVFQDKDTLIYELYLCHIHKGFMFAAWSVRWPNRRTQWIMKERFYVDECLPNQKRVWTSFLGQFFWQTDRGNKSCQCTFL